MLTLNNVLFHKTIKKIASFSNNYYKWDKKSYIMTTSQKPSRKISLEMKSEVHYKKAAKSYRKSQQYIKMINLYPTLQNTLIECKDENLIA